MEDHRKDILTALKRVTGSPDITEHTGNFRQTRRTLQQWRNTLAGTNDLVKHAIEGKHKIDTKQWTNAFNNICASVNASSHESTRNILRHISGVIDSMQSSSEEDDIDDNDDASDKDDGNGSDHGNDKNEEMGEETN
ncbi:hypothetical protein BJ875DRAFT_542466 [Amylocarpus encephaloides]|uniref:Uncharacterized protein n=1 Tax=Amylocarpus encephaloides TaxID=45428 RepID=A0A9P7YK10_9HELO|nr:hypothetical protein BJ875DRAFT_542466 [Amylocarpus encephaloides]